VVCREGADAAAILDTQPFAGLVVEVTDEAAPAALVDGAAAVIANGRATPKLQANAVVIHAGHGTDVGRAVGQALAHAGAWLDGDRPWADAAS
jgi:hypothetical protein